MCRSPFSSAANMLSAGITLFNPVNMHVSRAARADLWEEIMKLPRRRFLHLAAGAAALPAVSRVARAQAYPTRPVTIVVGTGAGGGADLLARIVAGRLSELLGQPFIIENVGNAVAAAKRVASAQPNGYIVDFGFTSTHAFHPSLYRKPFYDAINDFTPVTLVAEQSMFLVTRSDFPAGDLMEF